MLETDKGYQGHLEGINKEIPYRKPRNDTLTDVQDLYNKELGHFRVIVENFFARVFRSTGSWLNDSAKKRSTI